MTQKQWNDIAKSLEGLRGAMLECRDTYNQIAKVCVEAGKTETMLFQLAGKRLPADANLYEWDKSKKFRAIEPGQEKYKARIDSMLNKRTNFERMEAIVDQTKKSGIIDDIEKLDHKIAALRDRAGKDTGAEGRTATALADKLQGGTRFTLQGEIELHVKKFLEARHAVLNRILGLTEYWTTLFSEKPEICSGIVKELFLRNSEVDFADDLRALDLQIGDTV